MPESGSRMLRANGNLGSSHHNYHRQYRLLISMVMRQTRIVVTTPMNAPSFAKRNWDPDVVIFDEAGFCRDPEIFMVLTHCSSAQQVVLVGDDKQLGPPLFTSMGRKAW